MLDCFYPSFRLVLLLSEQETDNGRLTQLRPIEVDENDNFMAVVSNNLNKNFAKYQRKLKVMLAASEHKIMRRWGPESAATACRMVIVWLDEILIKSSWPGSKYWLRNPIQSEWGEGRSGGLWFFTQLNQLNPARSDDCKLAELALRCISFGLTGCYGHNLNDLAKVRRNVHEKFGFKSQTPIFPPPMPHSEAKWSYFGRFGKIFFTTLAFIILLTWLTVNASFNKKLHDLERQSRPPEVVMSDYLNVDPTEKYKSANSLYGQIDADAARQWHDKDAL